MCVYVYIYIYIVTFICVSVCKYIYIYINVTISQQKRYIIERFSLKQYTKNFVIMKNNFHFSL